MGRSMRAAIPNPPKRQKSIRTIASRMDSIFAFISPSRSLRRGATIGETRCRLLHFLLSKHSDGLPLIYLVRQPANIGAVHRHAVTHFFVGHVYLFPLVAQSPDVE